MASSASERDPIVLLKRFVAPLQISVTLKMDWDVGAVGKPIPASYVTNVKNGTLLVDILNIAAGETDKRGPFNNYDSNYLGGQGYIITAMNGTKQDPADSKYWRIFDEQTGGDVPCGVSYYIPSDNSTTIFRFLQVSNPSSYNNSVSGLCKLAPPSGQVK